MELRGRQRVMFIMFAVALLIVMLMTAYYGNINILTSNLYLLLFLGALYLDKNYNSKYVLVLSAAVLIVDQILTVVRYPSALLSTEYMIQLISYVGLYFFAMEFLKGTFRSKDKVNLIVLLTIPHLIVLLIGLIRFIMFGNLGISMGSLLNLSGILLSLIFPVSIIYYTLSRSKNRFEYFD